MKMEKGIVLLYFVMAFLDVQAVRRDNNVLLSSIKRLQFQLFKSIQKETDVVKTATFETQCSDAGCSRSICMKNGGNSCGDISMKCKQGFKMFRNHCYKFVTTKMNFFNAEMFCRTQQSSLVDIGDAEEDKWIKKISNELSSDVWISATDLAQAGEWKWLSTGLPLTFTNWYHNQPEQNNEHCAASTKLKWHDVPCSYRLVSVCKYTI